MRTKVSFGRTRICQKGVSLDEVMSNSAKFKSIALVVIELCLSEGIGKVEIRSVGWLVSQSVSL